MTDKKKKKGRPQAPTTLRIGLYDPGMTPLHRAGLGGLAATLLNLSKDNAPGSWTVERDHVELDWSEEGGPGELLDFVLQEGLKIDDTYGIIDFPAFKNRLGASPSLEARLTIQGAMMGTMLQHGKSRSLGSERLLVLDPERHASPRSYRPMEKFNHQGTAQDLSKALGAKGSDTVRIAGWAYPGAVEKHPGKSWSRMEMSASALLCLCFAPVGTFSFPVRSRLRKSMRSGALIIPMVKDLLRFARVRRQMAGFDAATLQVSSAADAGLMIAVAMHDGMRRAHTRGHEFLTLMTFGVQVWASQQKTRTEVIVMSTPEPRALAIYAHCAQLPQFQTRHVKGKKGYFYATSPVREAISDALAEGRRWYDGVAEAYIRADSSTRAAFHYHTERTGLHAMTQFSQSLYDNERLFVEVCHRAMNQIYGSLGSRAEANQTDFSAKAKTEMTKIRSSLLRAKNADTLRDALIQFWSKASRQKVATNLALKRSVQLEEDGSSQELPGWQVILPMLRDEEWRHARNLALVALISYGGVAQSSDEDDTEEVEDAEETS